LVEILVEKNVLVLKKVKVDRPLVSKVLVAMVTQLVRFVEARLVEAWMRNLKLGMPLKESWKELVLLEPFEPFVKYVNDHSFSNNCFYPSYPDLSVQDVLNVVKWQKARIEFLKNAPQ